MMVYDKGEAAQKAATVIMIHLSREPLLLLRFRKSPLLVLYNNVAEATVACADACILLVIHSSHSGESFPATRYCLSDIDAS